MQERFSVVSLLPYWAREIGPNLPRRQVTWELRAHDRLKFGCAVLSFAFNAYTVTFHLPSLLSHSSCFNENRCSCSSHKANVVHRRIQFLFTGGASLLSGAASSRWTTASHYTTNSRYNGLSKSCVKSFVATSSWAFRLPQYTAVSLPSLCLV